MPATPNVIFKKINKGIQSSTPLMGVSYVLARTTKGKFFDPSEVIRTQSEFAEKFGTEIVPDGSLSNISRALSMGATLRVCRIGHLDEGTLDATKGSVVGGEWDDTTGIYKLFEITLNDESIVNVNTLTLVLKGYGEDDININLSFNTKEYGGDINSSSGEFLLEFVMPTDGRVIGKIYDTNNLKRAASGSIINTNNLLSTQQFLKFNNPNEGKTPFIDTTIFRNWVNTNPYVETKLVSAVVPGTGTEDDLPYPDITTMEDVFTLLDSAQLIVGANLSVFLGYHNTGNILSTDLSIVMLGEVGDPGTVPVDADWKYGADIAKEYDEQYEVIASHVHQHLNDAGTMAIHQYIGAMATELWDWSYFIEVPKVNITKEQIIDYKTRVGYNSEMVSYFASGLKLYNTAGILTDSDVLGTVVGLSCKGQTQYYPWLSLAGQNRGIVGDAHGPVSYNFGGNGAFNELNEIAEAGINLFLAKKTKNAGNSTMLWHNFTSLLRTNSEQFLNVVRLILYIKKRLKPILESYLEEPNTITTWYKIYSEGKEILDNVMTGQGINDYEWLGDQFASSNENLEINNVADVKSGKYKIVLVIDEVVSLQQITLELTLDVINRSAGVNVVSINL